MAKGVKSDKWANAWDRDIWVSYKKKRFAKLDNYLSTRKIEPKCILDIGCGLAMESEWFQKKYGSELYLLDGSFIPDRNDDGYHKKTDKFAFYLEEDYLKESWNKRKLKYTFINAEDIHIPPDVKFDLIYSFKSCGFHYPVNTYKDLVKKHSTDKTVCIFDIKVSHEQEQAEHYKKINEIDHENQHRCLHIRFL